MDCGYRRTGGVDVAWTDYEERALRATAGRWRAEGIAHERLVPGDYARVEPALNPELKAVYYLPDRAQVRNPRLLQALMAAVSRRGGRLKPWHEVEGFEAHNGRVTAVRTAAGDLPCGMVVMAAGAWSGPLLETIGVRATTPPLKGQIVLLRCDRPLIHRIVEHGSELPGAARRRPDLGRSDRGGRRVRHSADVSLRSRPARSRPPALPHLESGQGRGDLGRAAARERGHQPLYRQSAGLRELDRRRGPPARRTAARAGHGRDRRSISCSTGHRAWRSDLFASAENPTQTDDETFRS